ncbi:MAG TPA: hypothetical protein VKR62_07965 [Roseiarcus sp.]|nr:hypothetical protein [Roseiarcus sp.]
MPQPNLSITHIVDPARNYEAVAGDLRPSKTDSNASCPGLADASNDPEGSDDGPARRFGDQIVTATEPAIRADERRACAEIVRGWLPRRQAFDSSFEDAMAALAEKLESRQ